MCKQFIQIKTEIERERKQESEIAIESERDVGKDTEVGHRVACTGVTDRSRKFHRRLRGKNNRWRLKQGGGGGGEAGDKERGKRVLTEEHGASSVQSGKQIMGTDGKTSCFQTLSRLPCMI